MCVHALLLLSCVHSLGLGLNLGNSLDWREGENAHTTRALTRIVELPKIKRQLILNDTCISHLLLTAYDFRGICDVLLLEKNTFNR